MNKIYWDGDMDVGLEDLSNLLVKISAEFRSNAIKCAKYSYDPKIQELITEESMNRFEAIVGCLSSDLKEIFYYTTDDIDSISVGESLGLKMKDWIMLGSAVEAILQIFLSVYLTDYQSSNWNQWISFNVDNAKKPIFEVIDKLVNDNVIESPQGKSLKEAIKKKIKEHTKLKSVDKVMLNDLILFFDNNNILDEDDVTCLRDIQNNRNCVHAYSNRNIGTWEDLKYCIRFFCYLMEVFIGQFPDLDHIDLSEW